MYGEYTYEVRSFQKYEGSRRQEITSEFGYQYINLELEPEDHEISTPQRNYRVRRDTYMLTKVAPEEKVSPKLQVSVPASDFKTAHHFNAAFLLLPADECHPSP